MKMYSTNNKTFIDFTSITTCFPSIAPIQWGKFHFSSNLSAMCNQSFSLKVDGRTSSSIQVQMTLHVSLIMLETVVAPIRYWYDIDFIESPAAKYL